MDVSEAERRGKKKKSKWCTEGKYRKQSIIGGCKKNEDKKKKKKNMKHEELCYKLRKWEQSMENMKINKLCLNIKTSFNNTKTKARDKIESVNNSRDKRIKEKNAQQNNQKCFLENKKRKKKKLFW